MKVKFLTVIWGARYIDEFARISLPSYLAPGNLPYVAHETELEIVILTSAEGEVYFKTLPIMGKLQALCPVRFILIDDLITTGVYGVTLTLAFARGIMSTGAEQTSTYFLFMNSDFVLADGSLRAAIAKFREGFSCVMAPSLRASAEPTIPMLTKAVMPEGDVLSLPPRDMVRLAFSNLHPTVMAKTMTQDFVSCETHNQIYWQVDESCLLARYHLIFMLAIKPEVPLRKINSYCDYGFVPELVPSGKYGYMDDSDDFFMLELQPARQEEELLRCGTKSLNEIAAELSRWTTREHRRFAQADIVFHTGQSAQELPDAQAEAERYMKVLHARMKMPAMDHVDHYYWVGGVQAWASVKFGTKPTVMPPELADIERGQSYKWYSHLLGRMQRRTRAIPDVPIWNWLWPDSRMLLDWVEEVRSMPPSRVLLLCGERSPLPDHLSKHLLIDVQIIGPDENGEPSEAIGRLDEASRQYDRVLIHILRAGVLDLRRQLAMADRYVGHQGTIAVFIEHKNSDLDYSNFSKELSQYAGRILPAGWMAHRMEARFVGGRARRRLRQIERIVYRLLWPASIKRLPMMFLGAGSWIVVAGLTALNNLCTRRASSHCPDYCTSALLLLSKWRPVTGSGHDPLASADHTAVGHLLLEE